MPAPRTPDDVLAAQIKRWNEGLYRDGIDAAAKKLKIARGTLHSRLKAARARGLKVMGGPTAASAEAKPAETAATVARPITEFRAEYDKSFIVPKRIRAALEQLGDGWLPEVEFAKLAGVNLADLGHFRSQFEENIVAIRRDGGKRAWARKTIATKMREMLS